MDGSVESTSCDQGHYPESLEKILRVLDAGTPWDVAAAIVIRTAYNDERRGRERAERIAADPSASPLLDRSIEGIVEDIIAGMARRRINPTALHGAVRRSAARTLSRDLIAAARLK